MSWHSSRVTQHFDASRPPTHYHLHHHPNAMKTYSRARATRVDADTHITKRRRIATETTEPCHTTEEALFQQQPPADLSSSSPRSKCGLFPDTRPPADEAVATPPSSPPPSIATPANLPSRRPTFSFLARKKNAAKPLIDADKNATKVPHHHQPKPKQKLVQMQLDLGRQLHKTCRVCGMEYIPSNAEDVLLHKKFHAMNLGGVDFGKAGDAEKLWRGAEGECVIAVGAKSSLAAKRRVEKVLGVVQMELGAVEIAGEQLWEETQTRKTQDECSSKSGKGHDRYKAFLYIQGSKCVGFCLAERISTASKVIPPASQKSEQQPLGASNDSSSISTSLDACPAVMGISRIWTSNSHRRKGVARVLLDCARKNFLYGIQVPKDMVAFSQPTASGGRLARGWFGMDYGWKAYAEDGDIVPKGRKTTKIPT